MTCVRYAAGWALAPQPLIVQYHSRDKMYRRILNRDVVVRSYSHSGNEEGAVVVTGAGIKQWAAGPVRLMDR